MSKIPHLPAILAFTSIACGTAGDEVATGTQAAAISPASATPSAVASAGVAAPLPSATDAVTYRGGVTGPDDVHGPPMPPVPAPPLEPPCSKDRVGPEWDAIRARKAATKLSSEEAQRRASAPEPAGPAQIAAQRAFTARAADIAADLAKLPEADREHAYQAAKDAHFAKAGVR